MYEKGILKKKYQANQFYKFIFMPLMEPSVDPQCP